MNNLEKRYSFSPENNTEYRAKITSDDPKSRKIRGYGVVFNQKSKIITEYMPEKQEWRTFFEIIAPTAFDKILGNGFDTVLDVNHDFDEILARIASGTLIISKDSKGLIYETELPTTARGEDVLQMVARGDYYESSFQFTIADGGDSWSYDQESGLWTRTVLIIDALYDMCIATYRGAYNDTSIEVGYREYKPEDIAVAKRKFDELVVEKRAATVEVNMPTAPDIIIEDDYLAEAELDSDKLKMI